MDADDPVDIVRPNGGEENGKFYVRECDAEIYRRAEEGSLKMSDPHIRVGDDGIMRYGGGNDE